MTPAAEKLCDMLHCYEPVVGTLQYRPLGHALHEGSFLYAVCADHLKKHRGEPGYRQVVWDPEQLRMVAPNETAP